MHTLKCHLLIGSIMSQSIYYGPGYFLSQFQRHFVIRPEMNASLETRLGAILCILAEQLFIGGKKIRI
jgi:hypothetical protein